MSRARVESCTAGDKHSRLRALEDFSPIRIDIRSARGENSENLLLAHFQLFKGRFPMADDFNFNNPYSAPQTSGQIPPIQEGSGLKSLGQEVRKTNLNKARWIMIILGVIQIGVSIFLYVSMQNEIRDAGRRGLIIDQDAVQMLWFIIVGAIAVGALLIGMGIFVYSYPVPFTITAFVLYVGDQLLGAALGGPEMLVKGIIFKVLIIAGLWSAIQAALAYEKERRMAPYQQF